MSKSLVNAQCVSDPTVHAWFMDLGQQARTQRGYIDEKKDTGGAKNISGPRVTDFFVPFICVVWRLNS